MDVEIETEMGGEGGNVDEEWWSRTSRTDLWLVPPPRNSLRVGEDL